VGCNSSSGGIQIGTDTNCGSFALGIDASSNDTFINRPSGGAIHFKEGNGATDQMTIASGGFVTIGSTNPFKASLAVQSRLPAEDLIDGFDLSGNAVFGLTSGGFVFATGFNGICRQDGNVTNGPICNQDFAEAYASSEPTEAGDLVALVPGAKATVRRSQKPYDALLAGVVSSNPGLVFDNGQTHLAGDNSQLITKDKTVVALVGRVPLKISMENGPIQVGDPISSSSKPGVGMKATEAGKIVGYALEPAEKDGRVLVYVQPGYHAAPEMAKLRASAQKLNRRAQEQELELQTLRQDNARLRSELNAILLQVNKINDQIVAASAKRGNATKNSPIRATEPVSEPMAH